MQVEYNITNADMEKYWQRWLNYILTPGSPFTPLVRDSAAKAWASWSKPPQVIYLLAKSEYLLKLQDNLPCSILAKLLYLLELQSDFSCNILTCL